ISVQELSTATITNDVSCGASNGGSGGQNGIAVFNSGSDTATARVRGTTAVYNARNGVTVSGQSSADCRRDALDPGNNAFTQNATRPTLNGANADNSTVPALALLAAGNQWQHCYANPLPLTAACDGQLALDMDGAVLWLPAQPQRDAAATLRIG